MVPGEGFMSNANTSLKNNRNLNSRTRNQTTRYSKRKRKGKFEFKRDEETLLKIRKKIKRRRQIRMIKRIVLALIVSVITVLCFYWAS